MALFEFCGYKMNCCKPIIKRKRINSGFCQNPGFCKTQNMMRIPDKSSIKRYILPQLSKPKRGGGDFLSTNSVYHKLLIITGL